MFDMAPWGDLFDREPTRDVLTSSKEHVMMRSTRRDFVRHTTTGLVLCTTSIVRAQTPAPTPPKRPDPLPSASVQEFVRRAHADLPGTKALLAEQPSLLNATWDWGGGDFETGIGGAGHMGNREIAEFLIGQGARFDIFVAAMLGRIDIVKTLLTAWPGLLHSRGPHGISLLRHARAGGDAAKEVTEYLQSLGAA
jgi:hypothetical protein